jgi:hypothetical protein
MKKGVSSMRRTLLFMATTTLALLVACGVALAASVNCPTNPNGYCYGTDRGDALYGTASLDRIYGYGGSDLMNGYGGGDLMYGGSEAGIGDKMRGGAGADLVNGQGGDDIIDGGPGQDTLNTGRGSDRVNAQDGEKDSITCQDNDDLVYYDEGLDVLEGCADGGRIGLPPEGLFEPGTKVLLGHGGRELCLPEKALKGHLEHGDEVMNWSGCTEQE